MLSKAYVVENVGSKSKLMVMRSEACGNCAAKGTCGAKPQMITVKNTLEAKVGDMVSLEMKNQVFFQNIFFVYLLPTLFLLAGIFISYFLLKDYPQQREIYSILIGFLSLGIFMLISRLIINKALKKEDMVVMLEKVAPDQERIEYDQCK